MKNKLLLLALLVPTLFVAQVGVGTTSVNASAKFQVDATDKGFLQPRVTLTGTSDTSTIATPATGLMVFNTATAGSGSTAVTPGVYYYTGTTWQRLADQTTATPTTFVDGSLGYPIYTSGEYMQGISHGTKTFNGEITLPPGKWEVVLNITAIISVQGDPGFMDIPSLEMSYWLQDNTNSEMIGYAFPTTPTNITNDALIPGGAMFTHPITLVSSRTAANSNHKGSFFINNTGSSSKTYHLFFQEASWYGESQMDNGIILFYNSFGGSAWKGNRFYAVKIN